MSSEVAYGRYIHGGPGPCWTGVHRETPTVSEARALLSHWVADRAAKAAVDVDAYKNSIKEEKKSIETWLQTNPEVQKVYRQAEILTQMGFNPVVEIVMGDNDEIELRLSLG